jgi:hypothetical protein
VYLMIGINNITWGQDPSVEVIGADYGRLLEAMVAAAGGAEIHVESTLPVRTQWPGDTANTRALNEIVRGHCERLGLDYIDLWPRMADASGELRAEYTGDGVHLTLGGYESWLEAISTPDEFFAIAQAIAPRWRDTGGNSHAIDAQDPQGPSEYGGGRGENMLVVLTPDYGHETTGTNQWGTEAIVEDGVVTRTGGNDNAIPANGFVVSGHGTAAGWIGSTLRPGTRVVLDGRTVRAELPPEGEMAGPARLGQLVDRVIEALPGLTGEEKLSDARAVLAELQALRADDARADPASIEALAERVAVLVPAAE